MITAITPHINHRIKRMIKASVLGSNILFILLEREGIMNQIIVIDIPTRPSILWLLMQQ
jgi:hypothetical protein